jgi:hypothetical protein
MYRVIPIQKQDNAPDQSQELLKIWEQKSGQKTNLCIEKLCTNQHIEGVMVAPADPHSGGNYIVPLCPKHRDSAREIMLDRSFKLVKLED